MTNTMLSLIRQMHDAGDDRARARVLLSVPDATLVKYAEVFGAACARAGFDAGALFVDLRVAGALAVRDAAGLLPGELMSAIEDHRAALAMFATAPSPTDL